MTAQGIWLVLLTAGLTVAANLLLRSGIHHAGGFGESFAKLPDTLLRLLAQPRFDLGFILYGLASLVWFRVISAEPLSTAYPLLVSLTYLLVTFGAVTLFAEILTLQKVIGLVVIIIGILIVAGGEL